MIGNRKEETINNQDNAVLRFDSFSFDMSAEKLTFDGAPVDLPRDAARLLKLLLSRPGVVVTHNDIEREIWAKRNVNIASSIHTAIRKLRKALGDDARGPKYLETIPKAGYRFIADVREEAGPTSNFILNGWRVLSFAAGVFAALVGLAVFFVSNADREGSALTQTGAYTAELSAPSIAAPLAAKYDLIWTSVPARGDLTITAGAENGVRDADAIVAESWAALRSVFLGASLQSARDLVNLALHTDPSSSYAHSTDAYLRLMFDHDIESAHLALQKALAQDPMNADAHRVYAYYHAFHGELESSVERMKLASQLWPQSALMRAEYGIFLGRSRKFGESRSVCEEAIAIQSNLRHAQLCLFYANWRLGDLAEMKRWGLALVANREGSTVDYNALRGLKGASFYNEFWKRTVAHYERLQHTDNAPRLAAYAMVYAGGGDTGMALKKLRAAYEEDSSKPYFITMQIDPHIDHLRNDPAFLAFQADARRLMLANKAAQH